MRPERIFVAEHAVDNDVYSRRLPADEIRSLRERLAPAGGKIVLSVARFAAEKGLVYLIHAMSHLTEAATLVIVGSGPLRVEIEELARHRGVHLVVLDAIRPVDMAAYYAASDVFVLPSVSTRMVKEPWGLAVNEAMCQATPVVVTTAVGAAAGGLVHDGETGVVVRERDGRALLRALEALLTNPSFAAQLGERGRKRVLATTLDGMDAAFTAAVEAAIQARKVPSPH